MKEVLTNQLDKMTQPIDISQFLLSATAGLIQWVQRQSDHGESDGSY